MQLNTCTNEAAEVATLEEEKKVLEMALKKSKDDYNSIIIGEGLSETQVYQMCSSIARYIHSQEELHFTSMQVNSESKQDGDRNILLRMLHYNVEEWFAFDLTKDDHVEIKRVIGWFSMMWWREGHPPTSAY